MCMEVERDVLAIRTALNTNRDLKWVPFAYHSPVVALQTRHPIREIRTSRCGLGTHNPQHMPNLPNIPNLPYLPHTLMHNMDNIRSINSRQICILPRAHIMVRMLR
jgi:hypothetical protein